MLPAKKNIVILGAGFAGLRTALTLAKKLRPHEVEILLIDPRDLHIYTPDLYEIATAFHEEINEACLTQLKETVAIPVSKIIAGSHIDFLRDTAVALEPAEKKVLLKKLGLLHFDYLVLALGSVVNYYGIPGLEEHALPLKTLTHALAINCHLDIFFHALWKKEEVKKVHIVIGGGGATGVELAAELPGCLSKLCAKYHYPHELVEISLVEAGARLAAQDEPGTAMITARLKKLGIEVKLHTAIREATSNSIQVDSNSGNKMMPADILMWTGGVAANPLIKEFFGAETAPNEKIPVNDFLQHQKFPWIYAAGDNAHFVDSHLKQEAPMLAQIAVQQGALIAENIAADIRKKTKKAYRMRIKGVIIPLGGTYAILKRNSFVLQGFWIWLLRRIVDLGYALSILPFFYALKKWVHDTNIFVAND